MWYVVIGIFLGLPVGVYLMLRRKLLTHRPENYPDTAQKLADKQVVVCAGDSITHGNTGVNYVDMLTDMFATGPWQFFNAGRNADLTYTLLDRLDDIIQLQPDVVTVLIGTNDVNATLSPWRLNEYRDIKRIAPDVTPDFDSFQANYRLIVDRLQTGTSAQLALASLPVMGEDLTHEANQKADRYSLFIRQLCDEKEITYLPVREAMKAYLAQFSTGRRYGYEASRRLLTASVARHYVLGHSWNRICVGNGNRLTQDMLHFNSVGARLIANTIVPFLHTSLHLQPTTSL
ncbi:hypothetical protein J2I47_14635 [Fibrella sp. HMF5335]|uniref:SGNH hydrolase-type esterase domain-containing protein n=1 Tax=Fibrella rubiginis TaxID=2817060 RepID=A0A939K5I2_9BACT|nr:GDSL-type esterase/lipase family protein [Fibrella rubiginis]MBO0937793.1 hypothetical protein [Fibrella rubiginis]